VEEIVERTVEQIIDVSTPPAVGGVVELMPQVVEEIVECTTEHIIDVSRSQTVKEID